MKSITYILCAALAAGLSLSATAQVQPKSKKVTELKYSGRIQAQWDGIESEEVGGENRNHFYFRRLFLGGHAKMGDHWGGDIVMDFGASTNNDNTVFIDGASVWYNHSDALRIDVGQIKVPFGLEETTSSSKLKSVERSAINRQFAEQLKFNARHTGLFAKGNFSDYFSYNIAAVNSGQNHTSKDADLKDGEYGSNPNELSYYGRLTYANYESELRNFFGIAAGMMEVGENGGNYPNAEDITAYNIFGGLGAGPFNIESEYMFGDVSGVNHDHDGYSIQASYALSNAPAGSWEFVYRYSTAENKNGEVGADQIVRRANFGTGSWKDVAKVDQNYFGVNYLFNGHDAKFMLGYEMNEITDEVVSNGKVDVDGFRARVQFLF
jgi:phosphate-selective porin OprO/OprP